MSTPPVKFVRLSHCISTPTRGSDGAAAFDLYAACKHTVELRPGVASRVPTGIMFEIPHGWAGLVLPRSSWALHHNVISDTPPIDSDYRGEVHMILRAMGRNHVIFTGERCAQIIFVPVLTELVEVDFLSETARGGLGFGGASGL